MTCEKIRNRIISRYFPTSSLVTSLLLTVRNLDNNLLSFNSFRGWRTRSGRSGCIREKMFLWSAMSRSYTTAVLLSETDYSRLNNRHWSVWLSGGLSSDSDVKFLLTATFSWVRWSSHLHPKSVQPIDCAKSYFTWKPDPSWKQASYKNNNKTRYKTTDKYGKVTWRIL